MLAFFILCFLFFLVSTLLDKEQLDIYKGKGNKGVWAKGSCWVQDAKRNLLHSSIFTGLSFIGMIVSWYD